MASNYLSNLKEGDRISYSVRPSSVRFHPPEGTKLPIVMIAAGMDIAPFRGFIQERVAQSVCGREVGETRLYFGCRTEDDLLYAKELEKWSRLGAVQVKSVFLRQGDPKKRKYVPDLLWEDRVDIARLFCQGARFYTCGSAKKLGVSVHACFTKIIDEKEQCHHEEAEKILEKISLERYSVDVIVSINVSERSQQRFASQSIELNSHWKHRSCLQRSKKLGRRDQRPEVEDIDSAEDGDRRVSNSHICQ